MRDEVKAANDEGNAILDEINAMANPRKALMDAEDAKLQAIIDAKAAEAEARPSMTKMSVWHGLKKGKEKHSHH